MTAAIASPGLPITYLGNSITVAAGTSDVQFSTKGQTILSNAAGASMATAFAAMALPPDRRLVGSVSEMSRRATPDACRIADLQPAFKPWRLDPGLVTAFRRSEAAFVNLMRPMIVGETEMLLGEFSRNWGLDDNLKFALTPEWENWVVRKVELKAGSDAESSHLKAILDMWESVFNSNFMMTQDRVPVIDADNWDHPRRMTFHLIPPDFLLRLPFLILGDNVLHYAPSTEAVSIEESARLAMLDQRTIYTGLSTAHIHNCDCLPYIVTFHDIVHTIEASSASRPFRTKNLKMQLLLAGLRDLSPETKQTVDLIRTVLNDQRSLDRPSYDRYFRFLGIFGNLEPEVLRAVYQGLSVYFSDSPEFPQILSGFQKAFPGLWEQP